MISYFAFYKVIFMVQLLIAEALFTFRLRRRSLFWLRWCLSAALCLACAALFPWEPQGPISLSLIFLLLFALTLACGFFCFKVSALSLLFCMAIAYAVQHFGYCVSNCMLLLSGLNSNVYGIYTEEVLSQHFLPVNEAFGFIFSFVTQSLCSTGRSFNPASGFGTGSSVASASAVTISNSSAGRAPGRTAGSTAAANLNGEAVDARTQGVSSPVSRRYCS